MYNIPRIITLTTIAHINVFNFPYLPKSVFKKKPHTQECAQNVEFKYLKFVSLKNSNFGNF